MRVESNLSSKDYIRPVESRIPYRVRIKEIVEPIIQEIQYSAVETLHVYCSSKPIDPNMAWASSDSINVCPLFVIELNEIPTEIRPEGWDDPRLCNLEFLQKLSDWIAEDCRIPKQKVSFIEAAAAKTIIKLKQDPQGIKAIRAGIVHELGHIALGHCLESSKSTKEKEKEADIYAAKQLHDGVEGIRIGFDAWQKSLKAVRTDSSFSLGTRILMRLMITPGGNFWPLYFTHGFFETRVSQVVEATKEIKRLCRDCKA